jgi:HEPN domain-containing protein
VAKGKRVKVERTQARSHLEKAEEFLAAADSSLESGRHDAAMLDAIHAAISAADAVTVALAGVRSTDPDHARAADLLEEVGPSGDVARHARQLRQLIARKNVVEYEARRSRATEASDAVKRARRFVGWARTVVEAAQF